MAHFYAEAFTKRFKVPRYPHYEEIMRRQVEQFRELYGSGA